MHKKVIDIFVSTKEKKKVTVELQLYSDQGFQYIFRLYFKRFTTKKEAHYRRKLRQPVFSRLFFIFQSPTEWGGGYGRSNSCWFWKNGGTQKSRGGRRGGWDGELPTLNAKDY